MDVSFSLGALNLLPLTQLDGAHALHEAVLLLLQLRKRRGGAGRRNGDSTLLAAYRGMVLVVGALFGLNLLLACLAAVG
jgi:membrane-associated protease RseP (regulator of RpoE activity)